ncbi:Serine/threonine-protein kinase OSR1, partial [Galemys pyrenaicus]
IQKKKRSITAELLRHTFFQKTKNKEILQVKVWQRAQTISERANKVWGTRCRWPFLLEKRWQLGVDKNSPDSLESFSSESEITFSLVLRLRNEKETEQKKLSAFQFEFTARRETVEGISQKLCWPGQWKACSGSSSLLAENHRRTSVKWICHFQTDTCC